MAEAPRDDNRVPSLVGASNENPRLPVVIWADPDTHRMLVNATITNSGNLVPFDYDFIDLNYTGSDLTEVIYKSGVTTVATLTLAYSGGNLNTITRS